MFALQFPPVFIHWIKAYTTSSQFSMKVNGGLCGWFPAGEGLKQGDPLSPYLFVLSMEVFSCLFNNAEANGSLPFNPKCKKTGINHL